MPSDLYRLEKQYSQDMLKGGGPRFVVLAIVVVLVVVASAPTATAFPEKAVGTQLDPDNVLMRVTVHENGTATWGVEYRVRFDDETAREAFTTVEEDVATEQETVVAPFRERMMATVASAERATGREMDLRDVRVTTTREAVPQSHGIVTYRFTWRGFAAVIGERIEIGDALSGLFLDEETTLLVSWPEDYEANDVSPVPTGGEREYAAVWNGPLAFDADEPVLTVTTGGALPVPVPVIGVTAIAVLGGGAVWYRRRGREDESEALTNTIADPTSPTTEQPDSRDETSVGRDPDPALLSNEERVVSLVSERGGRVKQQDIVEELDWTEAKTSRVVADLRDSGAVEMFRLGRENVVSLPANGTEGDDA